MEQRSVLINGGGVAGAAAADLFARAGWHTTIAELDPSSGGGQIVDVRGPAQQVLSRLGLLEQARALAVQEHGTTYWNDHGRRAVSMPAEMFGGGGVVGDLEIAHADLVGLLRADSGDSVEWLAGESVTALSMDGAAVAAWFRHTPARRFDLVVGADGVHSRIRSIIFPDRPHTQGYLGGYIAWFEAPALPGMSDGWLHIRAMGQGRAAMVRASRRGDRSLVSVLLRTDPLNIDRTDITRQRIYVAGRLAGGGFLATELAQAAANSSQFHLAPLTRVELPAWSSGAVALLGDAAWCGSPLTGQGTTMALVGAHCLATASTTTPDIPAGLTEYEKQLREWIGRRQKIRGGGLNALAPMTARGVKIGLTLARAMTRPPLRGLATRMFADSSDSYKLPDQPAFGAAA